MATYYRPTWADFYSTIGTGVSLPFTIRKGSNPVIYSGTIYSKSGSSETLMVNVAPVIRDYVMATYCQPDQQPNARNTDVLENSIMEFRVYQGSTLKDTIYYYLDYSLETLANTLSSCMRNDPIIARFTPTQGVFLTSFSTSLTAATWKDDDGREDPANYFSFAFTGITTQWLGEEDERWSTYKTFDVSKMTPYGKKVYFQIMPDCHRWCLDYLNAWGGWDSLLIEGTWREIDGYERGQYRTGDGLVTDSNVYVRNRRDKTDCLNTITKRYELNTALLTDDEASRMHHLLGSTNVYLRDLTLAEEYCSWAANITDSECEYKKHDGGTWAQYRIQVEISQQLTRQG